MTLCATRSDLADVAWVREGYQPRLGLIGAFHSAGGRIEREADRARDSMRILERDVDGSDMADAELQEAALATREGARLGRDPLLGVA